LQEQYGVTRRRAAFIARDQEQQANSGNAKAMQADPVSITEVVSLFLVAASIRAFALRGWTRPSEVT